MVNQNGVISCSKKEMGNLKKISQIKSIRLNRLASILRGKECEQKIPKHDNKKSQSFY